MPEHELPTEIRSEIDQPENQSTIENKELSAEVLEKIMDKVQDIYAYGTAYKSLPEKGRSIGSVTDEGFEGIFNDGLLGFPKGNELFKEELAKKGPRQAWIDNTKRMKLGEVNFNIVGRTLAIGNTYASNEISKFKKLEPGKLGKPFPRSKVLSPYYGYPIIVFDISKFQESEPVLGEEQHKASKTTLRETNTFRIRTYEDGSADMVPDEQGKIGIAPEYGFVLSFRVAPRNFRGLVVNNEAQKDRLLAVMEKVYKDKPEQMLPIYQQDTWNEDFQASDVEEMTVDQYNAMLEKTRGSYKLLWPKEMSEDEVKGFVAERDKAKKIQSAIDKTE